MQVLGDLVAEAREREGALFRAAERSAPYSYADFATNVWKTGNLLRHYGVREGARVAVVAGPKDPDDGDEPGWLGPEPTPLQVFLGAALDGAVVDLDPPGAVDATAFVAPAAWLDRYERGPGTKTLAYGGPTEDPTVAQLEREAWSENPLQPPGEVAPDDHALAADELYSHGELLAASRRVAADHDIDEDDAVAIRAPVTGAGAVVAGLLAPMRAGATVVLGDEAEGTVAVAAGDAPEGRTIAPESVL
ncbi:hypothetical protein [Halomicrobium urmianum]|uniref:hypothetical protein n=1 Tax=Halomicrobium urmianum TaxID=1586233 RepID=UPI001CD92574|nr:hypothetical protein [Halomicrobium urmianum]